MSCLKDLFLDENFWFLFVGILLNLGVVLGLGLLEKLLFLLLFVIKVFFLFLRLNCCIFLFNVFVGEVVKNVGMNGVMFKGEYGLFGVVEFDVEFGFDVIDGYGFVVFVIGDS